MNKKLSLSVLCFVLLASSSRGWAGEEKTVLEEKQKNIYEAAYNPFSIALYRPTYVLPISYMTAPDTQVYEGGGCPNQGVDHPEAKAQISLMMPIIARAYNKNRIALDIAYTQLSFWQVYRKSPYFRETDYEPEIFVENQFNENFLMRAGVDHKSNGMGNYLERSWNRAVVTVQMSKNNWMASVRAWAPIFVKNSSDLYNPDIAHYLGYENLLFSYRAGEAVFSVQAQNIESGFKRGFIEATVSYPLVNRLLIYGQGFSGYGQSLIEYNHRTQTVGIGVAFNDWI